MLSAQVPDIKPKSSNEEPKILRKNQHFMGQRVLHISTPDYSNISSKVNSFRGNSRITGSDKKVSGLMTCSMVQMRGRNLHGIGWKI